jgi:hypothetical protein
MKKLLICLLLISATSTFAQDAATIIKHDFETMVAYTRQKQMGKIVDMTYPQLFKIMTKEQMKASADGLLTGMGATMIFEEKPLMLKLSPVKKLANASICMGRYNQSIIMEFKDPSMIDMLTKVKMKDNKIEKLGKNKLRMSGVQYLLAIKDTYTNGTWKYLRYDDENAAIDAKVLSKEIQTGSAQLKAALNN